MKLHHYALRGIILEWCCIGKARVNQFSSETNNVAFGTPQGSVLGPLIFVVFINGVVNLCDAVIESYITLASDNMTLGCSYANIENLYMRINPGQQAHCINKSK